jgi:hypothetical protein
MVDQEEMNRTAHFAHLNGAPKGGDLIHSIVSLLELQMQLLQIDLRASLRRLILPCLLASTAAVAALGTFPIGLVFFAELLIQAGGFSRAAAFLASTLVGVVAATALGLGAWATWRIGVWNFRRSIDEGTRTRQWIKDTLKPAADSAGPRCHNISLKQQPENAKETNHGRDEPGA